MPGFNLGNLFLEARRRRVFRVAGLYLVGAWVLLQISSLALPAFALPDTAIRYVWIALILGFPVALVFGWRYDFVDGRIVRGNESDDLELSLQRPDYLILIGISVVIVAIIIGSITEITDTQQAIPVDQRIVDIDPASVAVLPFVNMSDDAGNVYFSEGLSEELLNLLVKIPELKVAARTSAFSFRENPDIQISEIARQLHVAHVLEGSVRKVGKQVRITAQLIKANDGFPLWSQSYDRTLDDIFVVQDDIAAAVVEALKINLFGEVPKSRETDPEAYALYMQGRYFNNLRSSEGYANAEEAYNKALAIDPEYAPAWVGVSRIYGHKIRTGELTREQGVAMSLEVIEKALAIDSTSASAWASLAYLKKGYQNWDWEAARIAVYKALALEPNNVDALGAASSLAADFGQIDKAIEFRERAVARDPLHVSNLNRLAGFYQRSGRFEEAIALINQILSLNPGYQGGMNHMLGRIYLENGDTERAIAEFNKLPEGGLNVTVNADLQIALGNESGARALLDEYLEIRSQESLVRTAIIYSMRGDIDQAFEWLDTALEVREPGLGAILSINYFKVLESDPRWPLLLEKIGLREAWEAMPQEE